MADLLAEITGECAAIFLKHDCFKGVVVIVSDFGAKSLVKSTIGSHEERYLVQNRVDLIDAKAIRRERE